MFILKKGHQPGVYVPLRALFLVQKRLPDAVRCCYALVICNHGPPTPGGGRGIAVEMSGVFTKDGNEYQN